MKQLIKIFLALMLFSVSVVSFADWWWNSTPDVYLCQWNECSLEQWALIAKDTIDTIENDRSLSVYITDIIQYLATFLSLIWVIIIIYAWFTILVSGWDEEKLKSARRMILYAIIWIVLIWLAHAIMLWFIEVLNKEPGP